MEKHGDNEDAVAACANPRKIGSRAGPLESAWALLASSIAARSDCLPLPEVERTARRIVEDLVFFRRCAEAGLSLFCDIEPGWLSSGCGERIEQLARRAEGMFGWGVCRLAEDPEGQAEQLPLAAADEESLGAVVLRLWQSSTSVGRESPGETLAWTHQRLLGLRLRRTPAGEIRVERTAEARKSAGVYYTPRLVTDYVARRVIRPALRGLSGKRFGRILDPACGCGAFLLAALRCLVGWHRRRGVALPLEQIACAIYGMDLDGEAVLAARRSLWLEMLAAAENSQRGGRDALVRRSPKLASVLAANIRRADALADSVVERLPAWFDVVLGNPPYRRELGAKAGLDQIASTDLGRFRSPRMDLWYYFLHRGLELLKPEGRLSFLVSSYWTAGRGAGKLIDALGRSGRLEEVFLLGQSRLFAGVAGQHMILTFKKGKTGGRTTIKRTACDSTFPPGKSPRAATRGLRKLVPVVIYRKDSRRVFCGSGLDLEPPADAIFARIGCWPALARLGSIRQGIVENPAAINPRTNRKHGNRWRDGEGVFALRPEEVARLCLPGRELALLRPYHALSDLGRYYVAVQPSRSLIYSTPETWSEADQRPALRDHLGRFRAVMDARRETRLGVRPWWQLHWPRDEALWQQPKIVALQMAPRPAFAHSAGPLYCPFSSNVFLPHRGAREDLRWFAALLNSRLMWSWFCRHAKRRGIGLEINGHVLARAPIPTVDLADPAQRVRHDRIVELAEEMATIAQRLRQLADGQRAGLLERQAGVERRIDEAVYELYGLSDSEVEAVERGLGEMIK